jgi:hypothetical protein
MESEGEFTLPARWLSKPTAYILRENIATNSDQFLREQGDRSRRECDSLAEPAHTTCDQRDSFFGCHRLFSCLGWCKVKEGESTLDGECHAHTAPNAKTRESFFRIAPNHLMQERDQDPAARGPNRMTDGNGTAVDVDL